MSVLVQLVKTMKDQGVGMNDVTVKLLVETHTNRGDLAAVSHCRNSEHIEIHAMANTQCTAESDQGLLLWPDVRHTRATCPRPSRCSRRPAKQSAWPRSTPRCTTWPSVPTGRRALSTRCGDSSRAEQGCVVERADGSCVCVDRVPASSCQALELCDEMRTLRLDPTKEGYAFIATMAIRDKKTYLISRTMDVMRQEGFSEEDVAYVKAVIVAELPDHLKHQAEGVVVPPGGEQA